MSTYRLKFINSLEKIGRVLELDAANDDDVTALSWVHSIRSDMTVEVWQDHRMVTRMTPMTARLFVDQPDSSARQCNERGAADIGSLPKL